MLDQFSVFSKTGVVLWQEDLSDEKVLGEPINSLVKNVLLEQRHVKQSYEHEEHAMKWILANDVGLVFVVVFNRIIGSNLTYLDELLQRVKREFLRMFNDRLVAPPAPITGQFDFSKTFHRIWRTIEDTVDNKAPIVNASAPDPGSDKMLQHGDSSDESSDGGKNPRLQENQSDGLASQSTSVSDIERARERLKQMKAARAKGAPRPGGPKSVNTNKNSTKPARKGKTIAARKNLTQKDIAELDVNNAMSKVKQVQKVQYSGDGTATEVDDSWFSDDDDDTSQSSWFARTKIGSLLGSLTGNKVLTEEDIQPVLDDLRTQLMEKNVASDIAQDLCDSVAESLLNKKLERLTLVQTQVRRALRDAIQRLLTPNRSTDVLAAVRAKRASADRRPYVIVFVGVNGVGKSTSLSKIVYHLKDNGMSVMMAACDSFRSGAVEQLGRHAAALDVPLFQRGYNSDPVHIAREAILQAQNEGTDVVVVDTAGRMQNNSTLMRALANLVNENQPDLVLFVGEALVGNDGVDQLCAFDKALIDYAMTSSPRRIDGIVLTKFDTIDDKVGASLSMVYRTGIPIFFVGTGQKYTNLRKLNVSAVVRSLLS